MSNTTIYDLLLHLKTNGYEIPYSMNVESGEEYEEWAGDQLELDRRNVFKTYYLGYPKVEIFGSKIPQWEHALMQAEEDYKSGYIRRAIDYLVMQLKIRPPHLVS